jgi:hypothetical protein
MRIASKANTPRSAHLGETEGAVKSTVTWRMTSNELGEILRLHFNRVHDQKIQVGNVSAYPETDCLDRPIGGHSFVFTGEVDTEQKDGAL